MAGKPGAHLTKITNRAKQLKKVHLKTKWTDLVKKAAKEIKSGVKAVKKAVKKTAVSGVKKKAVVKKTAPKKNTAIKKKDAPKRAAVKKVSSPKKVHKVATQKKPAHVAGVKKKKHGHSVGAVHGKGKLMHDVLTLVGSAIGGGIGTVLSPRIPGPGVVKGLVGTGAGLGVMHMFRSDKHPLLYGMGNGIGTAGLLVIGHSSGVMHGVDEMVSGIFGTMADEGDYAAGTYVEGQTAGTSDSNYQLNGGGYMGATAEEIESWYSHGAPPMGGE
jgi:hypothetical protein